MNGEPRRVVLTETDDGWTWKAQADNWRTVDKAKRPVARRSTAIRQIRDEYPDVEIIEAARVVA